NVLQRVGGSIGIAVLAVVLQRGLDSAQALAAHGAGPAQVLASAASAYGSAFWWATGLTAVAIVPSIILTRTEREARRRGEAEGVDQSTMAEAMAA
ncbi:MAG TPA: hypothetical protein VE127_13460, partial [Solirubrobacteraceae bacterium]|nr:hypothetical protein [Solirubrobacteraceae bacterium]